MEKFNRFKMISEINDTIVKYISPCFHHVKQFGGNGFSFDI